MAYDSVRAQLDKLLGPDRNGPLTAASTSPTDYQHPEICKNYLLGFCPDDLHIKHRSEPGSCRRRHSDSAKAAFEKDVASFKASREKARWTAALLSECRAIVMDEDRKIRCHARRLKETYNAQGDLAGLMIQNFETLKKLGMVSKDAKIRVLSEMDDEEFVTDPTPTEAVEREKETTLESRPTPGASTNSTLPMDDEGRTRSRKHGDQDRLATEQSNHNSNNNDGSESDSDSGKDDESDDDDDFGLIKVIPAVNKTPQEKGKPDTSLSKGSANCVVQAHSSPHSAPGTASDELKLKDNCDQRNAGTVTAIDAKDGSVRNSTSSPKKVPDAECVQPTAEVVSAGNREELKRDSGDAIREQPAANSQTEPSGLLEASQCDNRSVRDTSDTAKNTGKGQDRLESAPSMDEFYERGVGPDGLLMLDRKQSLRVCACCGGYISLVDAESRLLSHYGGKSHHSLAQLRKKVVELEAEASAEPVSSNGPSRGYLQDDPEERERAWLYRNNERRHSGERYGKAPERYQDRRGSRDGARFEDRRRVRSRRDGRGFGTSEWYNNFVHENDGGRSSRRGHERSNFDGSHSRRSNGRKRYRSRSPNRDFRRPRRHY